MFPAQDTFFVQTRDGVLTAKPLMDPVPAQPTNHQQHLLYAWRQRLVAALMHQCALIPEGVADVAWLEALQVASQQPSGAGENARAPLSRSSFGAGEAEFWRLQALNRQP
jgi:putative ATP-dependent endonuclease of the OLD family